VTKPKAEKPPEELSEQELEAANGEPLPDREAMSVLHGVEPLPLPVIPDEPITLDDPPPGV
jgi:hypothetical protein